MRNTTETPEQYPFTEHFKRTAATAVFPMQPLCKRPDGMVQFIPNRIVRDLLDFASRHTFDMHRIGMWHTKGDYTTAEMEQLYQLIGYTISGYAEMSFVTNPSFDAANTKAREQFPEEYEAREQ